MVKCADCGYLAVRGIMNGELLEADGKFRESGEVLFINTYGNQSRPKYEQQPICFARAENLIDEFEKETGKQNNTVSAKNVIVKDRNCTRGYTDWQQGFTPKEHREMLDRKQLLKWQAKREKEDKIFYPEVMNVLVQIHSLVSFIIINHLHADNFCRPMVWQRCRK